MQELKASFKKANLQEVEFDYTVDYVRKELT